MTTKQEVVQKIGKYRWLIAAMLLFSTTFNYMDRQVISYLKPYFCSPGGFGWTNSDFSILTSFFTGFYSLVTLFAGWIIDKIGTKLGLAFSLIIWSVFGIVNAFAGAAVWTHAFIRSLLAMGEAGNFPASVKTVAEWFPKKERALATGIFNSGSNLGAMIAALFVPWCMVFFGDGLGWKMAFIITGVTGFVWLIFWFWLYDSPNRQQRLSKEEYDYIHSDEEMVVVMSENKSRENVSWLQLFAYRQTWSFFFGKFMTDGIWWFYLFWLPDYLIKQFGMAPAEVTWPTFVVYGIAIIGSVFGGSIPMFMMTRGVPVYKARMSALFLIALFPLLVLTTQYFGNVSIFGNAAMYLAITIICVGAASHQAWSANLYTTVSDMFPKKAVGSVIGIGTTAGGIGGVLIQLLAGKLTDLYKFKGIAEGWTQAKLHNFQPAVDKLLALSTDKLDFNKIMLSEVPGDKVKPLINSVGQADWNMLLEIQKHAVQPSVTHAYSIMFIVCALAYIAAWGIIKLLVPKHNPIKDL